MPENLVAVVIPFYKNTITELEELALKQCFKVLNQHPIICIKPASLELDEILAQYQFSDIKVFENDYFSGIQGYNRLMLSPHFYEALSAYEYILLYQLDAYVFTDDLNYWCGQGYDYIGAPWLRLYDYPDLTKKLKSKFQTFIDTKFNVQKDGIPSDMQFENKVGNGGFSLRRVNKLYDLALKNPDIIAHYNAQSDHRFHEDVFWSIELNRKKTQLKIPGYKKALEFAFENSPERCFRLNNKRLPFGCHAWDKHLDFWEKYTINTNK